jgi:hypothetical protein
MAPVKGPSVLHAFVMHVVHHMTVMVMVHLHPSIHVVVMMPAFMHRSVMSDSWCCNCDRGQRRQYVSNLLHYFLLG